MFSLKDLFSTALSRKIGLALLLVLVGSVGLDQATKHQAQRDLVIYKNDRPLAKSIPIAKLGDAATGPYVGLHFTYARNKGAAFSMFHNLDDSIRVPLFYVIYIVATFVIFKILIDLPAYQIFFRFGLIMILSGAIGNILDRIQYGYVVDFIDVDWRLFGWYHDFAIFNFADIAINIGAIAVIIDLNRQRRLEKRLAAAEAAQTGGKGQKAGQKT